MDEESIVVIGSAAAVATCAGVAAARADGYAVVVREVDPATLEGGWFRRLWARRRLRRAAAAVGADALILLVERPGDADWTPWMVYAAGAGLRPIAVPTRLKGVENIAGVRSGVAVYARLETAADVACAFRAARAEAQNLAAAARLLK